MNWQSGVDTGTPLCQPVQMSRRTPLGITEAAFAEVVASSISVAETIRKLERAVVGTSYRLVRREVVRLGLDTSHWKGQAHGTSKQDIVPWDAVLTTGSPYHLTSSRKRRLINDGLLVETCFGCGNGPTWAGKSLTLVLDHINGVRDDHRIENLRLVCPNCDSQLSTFCGRNKRRR